MHDKQAPGHGLSTPLRGSGKTATTENGGQGQERTGKLHQRSLTSLSLCMISKSVLRRLVLHFKVAQVKCNNGYE